MSEYSEKDGNLLTLLSSAHKSVGEAGQKYVAGIEVIITQGKAMAGP